MSEYLFIFWFVCLFILDLRGCLYNLAWIAGYYTVCYRIQPTFCWDFVLLCSVTSNETSDITQCKQSIRYKLTQTVTTISQFPNRPLM